GDSAVAERDYLPEAAGLESRRDEEHVGARVDFPFERGVVDGYSDREVFSVPLSGPKNGLLVFFVARADDYYPVAEVDYLRDGFKEEVDAFLLRELGDDAQNGL